MGTGSVENLDVCSMGPPPVRPRTDACILWTASSGSEDDGGSERKECLANRAKVKIEHWQYILDTD